ncbi:MAG: hypothetical protein LH632_03650 [Rhodoferax sp.]|nr:hypothetical protein [Rhodoferax sp.]
MTKRGEEMRRDAVPTLLAPTGASDRAEPVDARVAITQWRQMAERLEPVIGARGVDALFGRALHLTTKKFPWLATNAALGNSADALAQLAARFDGQEASVAADAGAALLLTFTELLANMIGEPLTGRLLGALWNQDTPHSRKEKQA